MALAAQVVPQQRVIRIVISAAAHARHVRLPTRTQIREAPVKTAVIQVVRSRVRDRLHARQITPVRGIQAMRIPDIVCIRIHPDV